MGGLPGRAARPNRLVAPRPQGRSSPPAPPGPPRRAAPRARRPSRSPPRAVLALEAAAVLVGDYVAHLLHQVAEALDLLLGAEALDRTGGAKRGEWVGGRAGGVGLGWAGGRPVPSGELGCSFARDTRANAPRHGKAKSGPASTRPRAHAPHLREHEVQVALQRVAKARRVVVAVALQGGGVVGDQWMRGCHRRSGSSNKRITHTQLSNTCNPPKSNEPAGARACTHTPTPTPTFTHTRAHTHTSIYTYTPPPPHLEHVDQVYHHVCQLVHRARHVLDQHARARLARGADDGDEALADVPEDLGHLGGVGVGWGWVGWGWGWWGCG
jgi:hypothetical protein